MSSHCQSISSYCLLTTYPESSYFVSPIYPMSSIDHAKYLICYVMLSTFILIALQSKRKHAISFKQYNFIKTFLLEIVCKRHNLFKTKLVVKEILSITI